jgi:hypothetical protein
MGMVRLGCFDPCCLSRNGGPGPDILFSDFPYYGLVEPSSSYRVSHRPSERCLALSDTYYYYVHMNRTTTLHFNGLRASNNVQRENNLDKKCFSL